MRKKEGNKLIWYLFAGWAIGVLTLTLMMHMTHKTMHHEDWLVIVSTSCVMGGIFWHIYEFWLFEEARFEKRRRQSGL